MKNFILLFLTYCVLYYHASYVVAAEISSRHLHSYFFRLLFYSTSLHHFLCVYMHNNFPFSFFFHFLYARWLLPWYCCESFSTSFSFSVFFFLMCMYTYLLRQTRSSLSVTRWLSSSLSALTLCFRYKHISLIFFFYVIQWIMFEFTTLKTAMEEQKCSLFLSSLNNLFLFNTFLPSSSHTARKKALFACFSFKNPTSLFLFSFSFF